MAGRALRALAWLAPEAALRRSRAFAALEVQTRYAGATAGRRGEGWRQASASANDAIGSKLNVLRARSHEMVRDHWAFARILDVTVSHAIGYGIRILPDNGNDRTDRIVGEKFDAWADTADITGEGDLHGLTALALRSMLEGGSSLIRFVSRRQTDVRIVPLALCGLEGEHIDHARDGMVDTRRVRLGVALGEWDERLGYYVHRRHPNDPGTPGGWSESAFLPREEVVHLYRQMRLGQLLGVPVFAPVLLSARDLADLMDAVIMKAKIEACFAGFIRTIDGAGDPLAEITGPAVGDAAQDVTGFEPGMIARLRTGEDITFAQPNGGAASAFEPIYNATLYAMAAGAGITYDQLTGDLRQANYSSLRAGKIEFRRLIEQLQWLTIIPKVHARIATRWAEDAVVAGVLPERVGGYRWKYVTPANEPIDPKKDLEADVAAVRAGRMSPQEFIAGWGRDWREVVADFDAFLREVDAKGLVFDIDPRRVNKSGSGQPMPPATEDDEGTT